MAPLVVATVVGLIVLWPAGHPVDVQEGAPAQGRRFRAEVSGVRPSACRGVGRPGELECSEVEVVLESGPDEGETVSFIAAQGPNTRQLGVGDAILVGYAPGSPPGLEYFFSDYQRSLPLVALAGIFAVVVVLLSRWRGVAAIAGLAVSLFVLVRFVLPGILEGRSPLAVTVVGAAAIMLVTLYLAHGFSALTTTAVLGTLVSLALTGVLAVVFVELGRFSGLASEEALMLQVNAAQINLEGLLLGGIIIGALGVLDDVTVTQASAVWELHAANPGWGFGSLYRSALRIGRDHIASTVNTLVLAYAGSSLPLLLLFSVSNLALTDAVTGEVIAEEIVRTLVGSIGLVASVPITTGLASAVLLRDRTISGRERSVAAKPRTQGGEWSRPRREAEWREGG